MLGEIFYWVLNMSILGSIMGCVILLLRRIKILPRFGIYLLWAVPCVRFWIPFGVASEYSLMNLLSKFTTRTVVVYERIRYLPELTLSNSIMAADSYFPIEYKTDLLQNVFAVSAIVWIIFFTAAIISACLLYYFTKSEIKNTVHLKENIFQSDKISVPTVYGVFKPRIILPNGISESDMRYILIHERIHIRRRDNLLRVAAIVTACLHWFNPFAWIFLKYFFEDMELACDTKALKNCRDTQQKAYALALLNCAATKNLFVSAFGGAKIRVRIENILSYKKLTAASLVCFIALISTVAIVLITNATA